MQNLLLLVTEPRTRDNIKLARLYGVTMHLSIESQFHMGLVMWIYRVDAIVFTNTSGSKNVTTIMYTHLL
jgi:hypothetical protein